MKRFESVLARLNERLILPQPLKYRVLKEIDVDLEDTFEAYVNHGMSEQEAEQKALTKIAANDQVIEQLIEIHDTPVRKMLRKISSRTQIRLEVSLWLSLLVVVGALLARMMFSSAVFAGSVFNWGIGVVILIMISIILAKCYDLFIKCDHSLRHLHRGLPLLIYLSFAVIIFAIIGFFVEFQESLILLMEWNAEYTESAAIVMLRSFGIVSYGFAAAVIGAVMWLLLTMKTLTIEDHEHAFDI